MLKLTIDTGNAAFEADNGPDDPMTDEVRRDECARLLRIVAEQMSNGYTKGQCYDVNGNRVGVWTLT